MNKMLDKEAVVRILKAPNLPKKEYWVSSGAGLVLHGVKDSAKDIDLGCTNHLWERLLRQGYKIRTAGDLSEIMEINETVEVVKDWFADDIMLIAGVPVASLDDIKKQKLRLGREKDYSDIRLIDDFTARTL